MSADKSDALTQFDYLLNAFTHAAQDAAPAKRGYAAKRRALIAYVRDLEARAALAQPAPAAERKPLSDWQLVDLYRKWDATPGAGIADFGRMVERAHGIVETGGAT